MSYIPEISTSTRGLVGICNPNLPVCVDLDGTVVRTDTLVEAALALFRKAPWVVFAFPFWLLKGKAYFKHRVAMHTPLNAAWLPYRSEVLEILRTHRKAGGQVILATGANRSIALQVAEYLSIFDSVLASDEDMNLTGRRKLQALERKYGPRGFVYIGNSWADLPIWRAAAEAILVDAPRGVDSRLARENVVRSHILPDQGSRLLLIIRAIRPHHWIKNLLLFVPIVLAQKLWEVSLLADVVLSFVCLSLCASSAYIINDLLDLESDRRHDVKQRRPFASGLLPLGVGVAMVPALLLISAAFAALLPIAFRELLLLYFVLTIAYAFYLKGLVLVDVIVLAWLYTLRVLAGGAAATVYISSWLIAFSMFVHLSLALVKRYTELLNIRGQNRLSLVGRGYLAVDLEQLSQFGTSSAYVAVLIFVLYLNSPEARALYSEPKWLWFLCPLFFYWLSRIWLIAHRGEMNEDPIVFALKDRVTYGLGVTAALIVLTAL